MQERIASLGNSLNINSIIVLLMTVFLPQFSGMMTVVCNSILMTAKTQIYIPNIMCIYTTHQKNDVFEARITNASKLLRNRYHLISLPP